MSLPAWLIANVVTGLEGLVGTLQRIASGNSLDAAAAAKFTVQVATGPAPSRSVDAPTAAVTGIGTALAAIGAILPELVSPISGIDPSLAPAVLAAARAIGAAMAPASAYAVFAAAADAIPDPPLPPTGSDNRLIDAANGDIVARLSRLILLSPYAEAIVNQTYASRQDGITARADCVERFEREIALCHGAPDADVAEALTELRDRCVTYLSQKIAILAPVVTVRAAVSLPSLFWAWRLYQDPARAGELVTRNDVPHPSYMPLTFEALAPSVRFPGQS